MARTRRGFESPVGIRSVAEAGRARVPWLCGRGRSWRVGGGIAGALLIGGVLVFAVEESADVPPASGPVGRAARGVGGGVPVALPDLAALTGDYARYLRGRPEDGRSWAVLGAAYVEQGRLTGRPSYYPKAEKALKTSLKVLPERNAQAHDGLAALALARRDYPAARRWAEKAVRESPKRWVSYPALIEAYEGLGDHKRVRGTLDKLLALHSGPPVLARASQVYRDRDRREDAEAAIADATAGASTAAAEAAYSCQLGRLAWERGDPRAALRYYDAALRADPDRQAALAGKGGALAALGRTKEALRAYRTAVRRQPEPGYALELGEVYESLGRHGEARVQYEALRERVREAAAAGVDEALVRGRFEADHGNADTAVRLLRAEWVRQPGIAVADALGWALHRAGKAEEALEFAVRATDKEEGGGVRSALHAYHRGEIERALGREGAARRHLAEALRLNPHFSPLLAPRAEKALKALGEPSLEPPPETSEGSSEGSSEG